MKSMLLLTPFVIVACGDKNDDTATEQVTEQIFEPQEGAWIVSPLNVIEDTCGFGEEGPSEEGSTANLTDMGDGTFSLLIDEEMSFSCSLNQMDLVCDPTTVSEDLGSDSATMMYTYNVSITFESATELIGQMTLELSCEGDDCSQATNSEMTLPCSLNGNFTATAE